MANSSYLLKPLKITLIIIFVSVIACFGIKAAESFPPYFTFTADKDAYTVGDTLNLSLRSFSSNPSIQVDAYLALSIPGQSLLFFYPEFGTEPNPFYTGEVPDFYDPAFFTFRFSDEINAPEGQYAWIGALFVAGSYNLVGDVRSALFQYIPERPPPPPLRLLTVTPTFERPEIRVTFDRAINAGSLLENVRIELMTDSIPDFLLGTVPFTTIERGHADEYFNAQRLGDGSELLIRLRDGVLPRRRYGLIITVPVIIRTFPGVTAMDGGELNPQTIGPINISFEI